MFFVFDIVHLYSHMTASWLMNNELVIAFFAGRYYKLCFFCWKIVYIRCLKGNVKKGKLCRCEKELQDF